MQRGNDAGAYFDTRAGRYDDAYDRVNADGHALRARMDAVLRLLGHGPGTILDAGMGPGRLCAELADRGWTVSGIDASTEMVAAAGRRLPDAADRLVQAEIETLPFESESFDAVAATGVLEYADVRRALAELARVLRPGGRAVVSYPNPSALYAHWKTRVYYPAVRGVKRAAGKRVRDLPQGAGVIPPPRFTPLLVAAGIEPNDIVYTSYLVVPSPLEDLVPALAARISSGLEGGRGARRLATQVVYSGSKAGMP
jgi:ubiquinone/menaquinone biosynthesis C-methylase UbiE